MLELLIIALCFTLFILRLIKADQKNLYWAIALFMSGALIWFGFYFAVFPFQNAVSNTVVYNGANTIVNILNQTQQFPVTVPNTWEFYAALTFTFFWSFLMFLLGIWEFIDVMKNGSTDQHGQGKPI